MHPIERSRPADAESSRLAWARFPADTSTPVSAFLCLRSTGHRACLLESVETAALLTRFSFIGVDPEAEFRGGPAGNTLNRQGRSEALAGPTHEALREVARRHAVPHAPAGLPPFCGGWVGGFTYEWASALEPSIPRAAQDRWELPDAVFDLYRNVLAFDHATQAVYVVSSCPRGEADYRQGQARIDELIAHATCGVTQSGRFEVASSERRPSMSQERFEQGVEHLREATRRGEIFQAVLSQRFTTQMQGDPFTVYRALRLENPSPHMFFFEADGLVWIGSSPERLVSVRGGRVQGVPIAGTRRRGETPSEDDALAAELLADPKERAEHDMLVDLARNDLGRVARIGTVELREYATIERFSRVQHIVSRVEAELATGRDGLDALVACFPAGTVSGAPKIRAMQLLAELEGETRGPYAGCFGYLDGSGNLDMAIAIRTLFARGGELSLQVGAGVVHDSSPRHEYEETLAKARAMFAAIELAAGPAFQPDQATLDSSHTSEVQA